jgi:hypothetical protein
MLTSRKLKTHRRREGGWHGKRLGKVDWPYPDLGAKVLLLQPHSLVMCDSEVPAKDQLGDSSGVDVGVDEVIPEIFGHARDERKQNAPGHHKRP